MKKLYVILFIFCLVSISNLFAQTKLPSFVKEDSLRPLWAKSKLEEVVVENISLSGGSNNNNFSLSWNRLGRQYFYGEGTEEDFLNRLLSPPTTTPNGTITEYCLQRVRNEGDRYYFLFTTKIMYK